MSSKGTDHGALSHSGLATFPSIVGGVGQKGATYARGWRDQCGSSGSGDGTGGGTGGGTGAAAGAERRDGRRGHGCGDEEEGRGEHLPRGTRDGGGRRTRAAAVQSGSGLRGKDQI